MKLCEETAKEAGIIIAVIPLRKEVTFESITQTEIDKMSDDFFAAKGYPVQGNIERFEFNGETAVKVTGYSWKDAYYIFVNSEGARGTDLVLIGVKEGSADFKTTIENILNSIKFRQ